MYVYASTCTLYAGTLTIYTFSRTFQPILPSVKSTQHVMQQMYSDKITVRNLILLLEFSDFRNHVTSFARSEQAKPALLSVSVLQITAVHTYNLA